MSKSEKLIVNTVFEPVSRTQQDDQHKDSPGDAKSGKKSTQLILANYTKNFYSPINNIHWLVVKAGSKLVEFQSTSVLPK